MTVYAVSEYIRMRRYYVFLNGPKTIGGEGCKYYGKIACTDKYDKYWLAIFFLTEDSPVPNPTYNEGRKEGHIFVPFKYFMHYIDILRNEKPIYAYFSSENPENMGLRTSVSGEKVGEEERGFWF